MLGQTYDQANTGVGGFHDGIGGKARRHGDQADIGVGGCYSHAHGIEDGLAFEPLAAFARRHAANHVRAIFHHQLGMKAALPPGYALHQHLGVAIDEN